MRMALRGIGAREPDPEELEIGWLWAGFSAFQRVEFVEPDTNDPVTASLEIETLMDAAALAARDKR